MKHLKIKYKGQPLSFYIYLSCSDDKREKLAAKLIEEDIAIQSTVFPDNWGMLNK